ncbi:HIRAN domain-containing protein [Ruminococcaceae bacterium OttesenSCG-928-I18]|nr:HIRAN domain-containing protein [Ruminococcaceae bacterium OttesenSCG-928-I18]
MFENELYITITGLNHYFGMRPFKIGSLVTLIKEPDNVYDDEAIMVMAPMLGKVGYVANSPHTTASGCISAGRLYDEVPDECAAAVRFMTASKVIARVMPDKRLHVKVEIALEDATRSSDGIPTMDDVVEHTTEKSEVD